MSVGAIGIRCDGLLDKSHGCRKVAALPLHHAQPV